MKTRMFYKIVYLHGTLYIEALTIILNYKAEFLSSFIDKISFNQSAIIYNKDLTNYVYF